MAMDVFGLLGNPVGHSLSPPLHEAAYNELGLEARYVTFEPEPDAVEAAVEGADALGITGLNVTIPFKQDVLEYVVADELASQIGAVNTIDFTGSGPPTGHNTDAVGVVRSFRKHDVTLEGATAVVIGAGGAGRAAAFGLDEAGATVAIANRTETTAHELADEVPSGTGYGLETETLTDLIRDADVLVNATSVGMNADTSPVPADALHSEVTVLDAVYQPLETQLLTDAATAGATTIDGAWMLLYQGVEAVEIWTGEEPPVETMNDALRSRL